ncbi:hypothetical protein CRYUN_Cryun14cG0093100 [Craigia yunnanensis]
MAVNDNLLVCTPLECETAEEMLASMEKAKAEGADLVELCIASMSLSHISEVDKLIKRRTLPAIVSFRLKSSRTLSKGGCYNTCMEVLKRALELDVEFVELDYEVASDVNMAEYLYNRSNSRIIVSSYVNGGKPSTEKLGDLIACIQATGADVIKLDICVDYITDLAPVFTILTHCQSIGAVNTIVRRPMDGKLIGYNTDCEASISAIEDALRERRVSNNGSPHSTSPISGRIFALVGAGGAGRALAFGAKSKGARIVIFNRNYERAKALADAVSGEALPYECLENFCPEKGMILANASAVGMEPNPHQSPVSKEALRAYDLVFDAVYTPRNTRLLKEAAEVGATVVSGVEMFVRQALGQFRLFTGGLAPEDFMRKLVLEQF